MNVSSGTLLLAGGIGAIGAAATLAYLLQQRRKQQYARELVYNVVQERRAASNSQGRKRVLITGGCGFLGRSIVQNIHDTLGSNVEIVVMDAAVHDRFGPLLPDATYIQGDVCSYSHVLKALEGCAGVVHTAAVLATVTTPPGLLERVNVRGTRHVVEACVEMGVSALVYTSSASVTLDTATNPPASQPVPPPALEDAPLPPMERLNGEYARSKAIAEELVLSANCQQLRTVALRPAGIYGINDIGIVTNALEGKPYVGPGTALSPVVWVEDAARAHTLAIQRLLQLPASIPASATTTTTTSKSGSSAGEQQQQQQAGSQQDDGSAIAGRAFHLSHDPITDHFVYADFAGGTALPPLSSLQQSGGGSSGSESAARGQGQQGSGTTVNAYGMPVVGTVPRWLIGGLARVNEFTGRAFGVAVIDPRLFMANLVYTDVHWPVDISNARRLLGWQPTPWRHVAAQLAAQWAERRGAQA